MVYKKTHLMIFFFERNPELYEARGYALRTQGPKQFHLLQWELQILAGKTQPRIIAK